MREQPGDVRIQQESTVRDVGSIQDAADPQRRPRHQECRPSKGISDPSPIVQEGKQTPNDDSGDHVTAQVIEQFPPGACTTDFCSKESKFDQFPLVLYDLSAVSRQKARKNPKEKSEKVEKGDAGTPNRAA